MSFASYHFIDKNEIQPLDDHKIEKSEQTVFKNYSQVLTELYKIWDEFQPMNLSSVHPTCEFVYPWGMQEEKEASNSNLKKECPYGLTIENQTALLSYLSVLIQITLNVIDSLNHCEVIVMKKPPVQEQRTFDDIEIENIPITGNLALVRAGNNLYYVNKLNNQCIEIKDFKSSIETFDHIVGLNENDTHPIHHRIPLSKEQLKKINELELNGLPILQLLVKERDASWKPLLFRSYRGREKNHIFEEKESRYFDVTSFYVSIKSSTKEEQLSLMLHAENHQCEIIRRKDQKEQVKNIYTTEERAHFLYNFFLNLFISHFKKIQEYIKETQGKKDSHIDLMNSFSSKLRETSRGQCIEGRTRSAFEYIEKLHFTTVTFNGLIYPWIERYLAKTKKEEWSYLSCFAYLIENIWDEPFEQEEKDNESYCKEKGIININLYPVIARCIRQLSCVDFRNDYHTVAEKLSSPQKKIIFFSCLLQEPYFLQSIGIGALEGINEPAWQPEHLTRLGYDRNTLHDTDLDPTEIKLSTDDQEKNQNLSHLLETLRHPNYIDLIQFAKKSGCSNLLIEKLLQAISKDHLLEIIKTIRATWILDKQLINTLNIKFKDDPVWSKIYNNLVLYKDDYSQLINNYSELSKQFINIKSYYELIRLSIVHDEKQSGKIVNMFKHPEQLIDKLNVNGFLNLVNTSYVLYANKNSEFILSFLTRLTKMKRMHSADILYLIYHNNIVKHQQINEKLISFIIDQLIQYKKHNYSEIKDIPSEKEKREANGEHAYRQLWAFPVDPETRDTLISEGIKTKKEKNIVALLNQLPPSEKRILLLKKPSSIVWPAKIITQLKIDNETLLAWFQLANYDNFPEANKIFLSKFKASKDKASFQHGLKYLFLQSTLHNDNQKKFNKAYFELIINTIGIPDFLDILHSLLMQGHFPNGRSASTISLCVWIFKIINNEFDQNSNLKLLCIKILNAIVDENENEFYSFLSIVFRSDFEEEEINKINSNLFDIIARHKILFGVDIHATSVLHFLKKLNTAQCKIFMNNFVETKIFKIFVSTMFNRKHEYNLFHDVIKYHITDAEFFYYVNQNGVTFKVLSALEALEKLFTPLQCLKLLPKCDDNLLNSGYEIIKKWIEECPFPSADIQKILDDTIPKIINQLDKKDNNELIYFMEKLSKENLVTHIKKMSNLTSDNLSEIINHFKLTNDELINILLTKSVWSLDNSNIDFLFILADRFIDTPNEYLHILKLNNALSRITKENVDNFNFICDITLIYAISCNLSPLEIISIFRQIDFRYPLDDMLFFNDIAKTKIEFVCDLLSPFQHDEELFQSLNSQASVFNQFILIIFQKNIKNGMTLLLEQGKDGHPYYRYFVSYLQLLVYKFPSQKDAIFIIDTLFSLPNNELEKCFGIVLIDNRSLYHLFSLLFQKASNNHPDTKLLLLPYESISGVINSHPFNILINKMRELWKNISLQQRYDIIQENSQPALNPTNNLLQSITPVSDLDHSQNIVKKMQMWKKKPLPESELNSLRETKKRFSHN
jgi:hypothetical protein